MDLELFVLDKKLAQYHQDSRQVMKKISALIANIPLLTGVIIGLSILKYHIYYKLFYIQISHYLQISEVILLFTEDIIYILIFLCVPRFIGHIEELVHTELDERKIIDEEDARLITLQQLKDFTKRRNILAGAMSFLLLGSVIFAFFGDRLDRMSALLAAICILGILFFIFWERDLTKQNIRYEIRQYLYIAMLFLILILVLSVRTISEVKSVYNGKFIGTTVITKDSTYVSDSLHFYIGRTSQYTYIFNKPDSSSSIIPNSEIRLVNLMTGKRK